MTYLQPIDPAISAEYSDVEDQIWDVKNSITRCCQIIKLYGGAPSYLETEERILQELGRRPNPARVLVRAICQRV